MGLGHGAPTHELAASQHCSEHVGRRPRTRRRRASSCCSSGYPLAAPRRRRRPLPAGAPRGNGCGEPPLTGGPGTPGRPSVGVTPRRGELDEEGTTRLLQQLPPLVRPAPSSGTVAAARRSPGRARTPAPHCRPAHLSELGCVEGRGPGEHGRGGEGARGDGAREKGGRVAARASRHTGGGGGEAQQVVGGGGVWGDTVGSMGRVRKGAGVGGAVWGAGGTTGGERHTPDAVIRFVSLPDELGIDCVRLQLTGPGEGSFLKPSSPLSPLTYFPKGSDTTQVTDNSSARRRGCLTPSHCSVPCSLRGSLAAHRRSLAGTRHSRTL